MMNIYEQLEIDEGRRTFPYTDTVGKLTIGIGHNLTDKGLTNDQIDQLLRDDVAEVQSYLNTFPWFKALDEVRQAAIINMAFNLGVNGLLKFQNMMAFLNAGKYAEAADEMLRSKWATQVGARATRLSLQLRTGQWPSLPATLDAQDI
jgi:lysozyme